MLMFAGNLDTVKGCEEAIRFQLDETTSRRVARDKAKKATAVPARRSDRWPVVMPESWLE